MRKHYAFFGLNKHVGLHSEPIRLNAVRTTRANPDGTIAPDSPKWHINVNLLEAAAVAIDGVSCMEECACP